MSNLSTLPKGDSAWLLRKAIERIIQQVSVLETNIGASTTGNSANTQVIFNDNGTLRGDPDLTFNKALNKLVATNLESTTTLVVGTSAAITGALTVTGAANLNGAVNLSLAGTATVTLGATATYGVLVGSGTNAASIYINGATRPGFNAMLQFGAAEHQFYNSSLSSLIATLNTTGLGIGTATPASALSFPIGTIKAVGMTATTAHLAGNVSTLKYGINDGGGDFGGVHVFNIHNGTYSSSEVGIFTGEGGVSVPTQRMRIDKVGNVGIGVTPSAWGRGKGLEVGSIGNAFWCDSGSNGILSISANAYLTTGDLTTGWKYASTAPAGRYQISETTHSWYTAASGTAGNAITFTQAMTLDASGRLGIGTASPTAALNVNLAEVSAAAGTAAIITNTTSGGNRIAALRLQNLSSQWNIRAYGAVTDDLRFGSGSTGSETDYLTVNTSGNVTISTGNVVMATSGKGIDFSAVTGGTGTATANVLNDYEEGTWTPTFTASAGTPTTVTLVSAAYTKIGRRVSIDVDFVISAIGTASGTLFLTLPFSQSTASTPCGAFVEVSVVGYMGAIFQIDATRVGLNFYNNATTWVNGYRYRGTYTYNV